MVAMALALFAVAFTACGDDETESADESSAITAFDADDSGDESGEDATADEQDAVGSENDSASDVDDSSGITASAATLEIDGESFDLTVSNCNVLPTSPISIGFAAENADGSVEASGQLPGGVSITYQDEFWDAAGDFEFATSEVDGGGRATASGTAPITTGAGDTIEFELSVECATS